MGQQVVGAGEPTIGRRSEGAESAPSDPKPGELATARPKVEPEGRTRGCCKTLGGAVARGDKPIKLGDSWFSAKRILVRQAREGRWGRTGLGLVQSRAFGLDKDAAHGAETDLGARRCWV